MSSSYIRATYFELTYPVLQNICDKNKIFRGHTLYFDNIDIASNFFIWRFSIPFRTYTNTINSRRKRVITTIGRDTHAAVMFVIWLN